MPDVELLIDESGVPEEESSVSDDPVQEQESSSEDSTDEEVEDSSPDFHPDYFPEDYVPDETETDSSESEYVDSEEPSTEDDILSDDGSSVSGNDVDYEYIQEMINRSVSENNALYFSEDYVILEDLEEFESSTVLVDRYQYAVLERLEFLQYASAIVIALLFLILFMRYKK